MPAANGVAWQTGPSFRLVSRDGGRHVNPASRSRLDPFDAALFEGAALYARLGRVVCAANCLPRKEFFEAWEVGRRVQRRLRGFIREQPDTVLVDLAAGHGFLAWVLLLLEPRIRTALCVDKHKPASAGRLQAALEEGFPYLAGRLRYVEGDLRQVAASKRTLLVSVHACGGLTDLVLDHAVGASAPVAVVPCCHVLGRDAGGLLRGWLPGPVAVDVQRAARLEAAGYTVSTHLIPPAITPENRLLIGLPPSQEGQGGRDGQGGGHILPASGPEDLSGSFAADCSCPKASQLRHLRQLDDIWGRRPLPDSPWRLFRTGLLD